ncbi:MAG: TraM recognition domain-containing protein [Renibacterium salmoninarum]|uniref:type IV secretory system conjugative DNA transfer family protein n=1 Tax=Bacillati TaxID=1783272 RepID=UPI00264D32F7|nr:TraM recognition domain-containing protein [Renibacterium salmoninarum]
MSGLFSRQTKTVPATPAATKPAGDRAVVSAGGHRLGPIVGQVESTNIRFRLRDTVLVVGAPGSGKTSGIVIPYVADSAGAVVTSSTRPDVLRATGAIRERLGKVHVADFEGLSRWPHALRWDMVAGCTEPASATARASGMVAAAPRAGRPDRTSAFFEGGCRIILQGLFHAASLKPGGSMVDVIKWALNFDDKTPANIIAGSSSPVQAWADELHRWCRGKADETRAGLEMTLSTLIGPMLDSRVLEQLCPGPGALNIDDFLTSTDTLYCLTRASINSSTAPIVTALVESIYQRGILLSGASRTGKLSPEMTFVLDEVANTAPLPSLQSLMSEGGGNGFHTMALSQGFSQFTDRWGSETAETIWQSSTAKIFFGASSEDKLLEKVAGLIGKEWTQHTSASSNSGQSGIGSSGVSTSMHLDYRLRPDEIRKVPEGQALLLYKELDEILNVPYWFDRADADRFAASQTHILGIEGL